MKSSRLQHAACASLGIVAAVALAGCNKAGAQSGLTPANPTMATPAATAALPPGNYYGQTPAAPAAVPGAPVAARGGAPADPPAAPVFAQVVAVQPVTQQTTQSSPHRVCRQEEVAVPETYRDSHQVGGAVAGGVLGALAGHVIGGGRGRTLATLAGAAGGAFAGHEIQKRHQANHPSRMAMRNVCHAVDDRTTAMATVGYDVTYLRDGRAGHIQLAHAPIVGTGLPVRNGVVVAPGALPSAGTMAIGDGEANGDDQ